MAYKRKRYTLFDIIIFVVLISITLITFFPVVYMVAVSFSDKSAVAAGIVTVFPVKPTLAAYKSVIKDNYFFTSFGVSVRRVLLGCSINFALTVLTAFPLSRRDSEFKGRNVYMWILIFTMLFSAGMIPLYFTVKSLHLLDTMWALVLPGAVPVFNIIVLMNFFRNLPKALDEAAVIDGAGPWYMLLKIYLPMSLPALATVTLFSVVGHWNSFFDGLIYMKTQNHYPLQTYLNQTIIQYSMVSKNMTKEEIERLTKLSDKTVNSAKILISMIPILLVYPFLQRYFITGITLGSVKE
ncbi:MAG: carbohydrate ABC transporter permease [Clostridiales bacterium]|nr:carbohydrate ABC transporter permease [Clostridiales bacterium]HBM80540.1 ABC transporter permease [Clostridiaceae bacterium]